MNAQTKSGNAVAVIDFTPRGKLVENASLTPLTWFRTGGVADMLFTPADEADLADFLKVLAPDVPITVLGLGSNVLVRDGGIRGAVILLGSAMGAIEVEGNTIRAGAGAADVKLARTALKAGLSGLSFFRGIPGTIGGAIRMNGGAYGRETADVLIEARGLNRQGELRTFSNADMGYSYRHTDVDDTWIFTQALFQGAPGVADEIAAEMKAITKARGETQPVGSRTGGSTFKNPPGAKAWELVDQAGCRGFMIGGAQVSELHCNFLINTGGATAHDLEQLGETVRTRVLEKSGIELEWEIRRLGEAVQGEGE